jgi:hypothetical protein
VRLQPDGQRVGHLSGMRDCAKQAWERRMRCRTL